MLSRSIVKLVRSFFRLPDWTIAPVLFCLYKAVRALNLPQMAIGYAYDAYCAMRDGPPLSISLRRLILESDPAMFEDLLFNSLRGDAPLKDTNPWR